LPMRAVFLFLDSVLLKERFHVSEHIHKDSFFCGSAVAQEVNDFIFQSYDLLS